VARSGGQRVGVCHGTAVVAVSDPLANEEGKQEEEEADKEEEERRRRWRRGWAHNHVTSPYTRRRIPRRYSSAADYA
jgi:hypothetical protein